MEKILLALLGVWREDMFLSYEPPRTLRGAQPMMIVVHNNAIIRLLIIANS